MSDKSITIIGTLASVFGLVLTLYTVIFTEYKFVSLLSLILFETIGLVIWVYYVREKNKVLFPYEYENELVFIRYTYESDRKMEYEAIKAVKVTCPNISVMPVSLFWSGKGNIHIESDFSNQDIDFNFDGKSGKINFNYPISQSYKFGDTFVIHFRLKLEDTTGENAPELSYSVKQPTKFFVLETILKYKETNPPAVFSYIAELAPITVNTKVRDVNFDEKTKSYRINIPNPILKYTYKLNWTK